MKSSINLTDDVLAEFLYSLLYGATIEDRNAMPEKYRPLLSSEKRAKKFVRTSTIDEKIAVLSYFRVKHFLVLLDDKKKIEC